MQKKKSIWIIYVSVIFLVGSTIFVASSSAEVANVSSIIEIRVDVSDNDAEEQSDGSVSTTSSDLELVEESNGGVQVVGIRFTDVTVPPQATITAAYLQFQVDEARSEVTSLTIAGQAADYAPIFTTVNSNISSRSTTTANVNWSPAPWSTVGEAGPDQQTPDLSVVVQEIIDRPGWSYGNALAFIIAGSGARVAEAFNGVPEAAPLLHLEYTGGVFPTDTPTPTPLPPGINYRFAVIGDYGVDSSNEGRVATMIAGWDPDFVITLGDNNYPDGEASTIDQNIGQYYSQFIGNYQGAYGNGSPINRFWPALGNHDWHSITCNTTGCSGPYFDYFTLPGNERYYDVDFGLVRLFALDSDSGEPDGRHLGELQSIWLQNELTASSSCFNIVYFHHAPYSSGNHGSSSDMQWPFADWGADVVMSGHDHDYERLDVDGIPYIVNGIGGVRLEPYPNIGNLPPEVTSVIRYNEDAGAMLVTVTETGMSLQLYNADNILIDTYNINKDCVTVPTATPTPTLLPTETATPLPTDTPTATATDGPTLTPSSTSPPTDTVTPTPVPTNTATSTPLPTSSPTSEPPQSPTVVNTSSGIADGASLTLPHATSGTNRLLLVGVSINNNTFETVTSITYNGLPLTYVNSEMQSDDARVEIWQLIDPPIGTHDVELTFSADLARYAVVGVLTLNGVDQTEPLRAFAGNNATSSTASVTVPTAANDLVVGIFSCETCTSITNLSPSVEHWNLAAGNGNEIGAGITQAVGGPQVTLNASLGSSDHWAWGAVSVRPVIVINPTSTPTNTPLPTATPTSTATSTPLPTATNMSIPTATATDTPVPTATDTPEPTATNTPLPTATDTPVPTATATSTPLPTAANTPVPTATATDTPEPTATNTPVPTATATSTPLPTATNTPVPTTATATDTPEPTATNTPLPTATDTPTPTATAAPGSVHVGDLDGRADSLPGGIWTAYTTISVHDNNGDPLANVEVHGIWSGGASGDVSCVTDDNGLCIVAASGIPKREKAATFSVVDVIDITQPYEPSANHDPDNDSDGTTIIVTR